MNQGVFAARDGFTVPLIGWMLAALRRPRLSTPDPINRLALCPNCSAAISQNSCARSNLLPVARHCRSPRARRYLFQPINFVGWGGGGHRQQTGRCHFLRLKAQSVGQSVIKQKYGIRYEEGSCRPVSAGTAKSEASRRRHEPGMSVSRQRADQFGIGTLMVNAPTHSFGFRGPKLMWQSTHAGWKLLRGSERR